VRLASLLADLTEEQLDHLRIEHIGDDDKVSRGALCRTLESVLKSYSFVREFIGDRLPPTFSILELLLDAPGYSLPLEGFRETVTSHCQGLLERVASGDLVGRDDAQRLYRSVLLEARRNDSRLDPSETSILGVLRRELRIRAVEHFLIEHHPSFREFWGSDHAFLDSIGALRSSGLIFAHEGNVVLAEEVVPVARQALGLEMSAASRRRLYEHLSATDLGAALGALKLKTSGSREAKLERLLGNYAQPSDVLGELPGQTLKSICRDTGVASSGAKEDLVERLGQHFMLNRDVDSSTDGEMVEETAPEPEPRRLSLPRFRALFWGIKGDQLTDILTDVGSRRVTGAKDVKVKLIEQSPFSEATLLGHLTTRALEDALYRHRLKTSGSKGDRIERLVDFFATAPEDAITEPVESIAERGGVPRAESAESSGGLGNESRSASDPPRPT
jgi:hypothetical protein